ncbi:MAG: L-threo-3-hydroxyaspartate ammonia-lyase [uncultured Thermomicrobiales bacterium]|uniref:L-threo-3-hydroxyaspartate ammonia-lyase n=1 Tax=uncultured Thermomicrobiales bacterium TaxID=1645740 RepID=A0A6J4ULB9_9BACT|nr:MAG: L-threo-3-hydroxyaspartate ammonia-lyase [uncultured Thermomicrobiales bacterium]
MNPVAPPVPRDLAPPAITFDDVQRAAGRLRGVAHRTPVLTSTMLDERTGATVFVKAENHQRMGAFKFRGGYNAVAALDPETRARGVVTASSGNHAQAVALAARLHGIPAWIVMPEDAPPLKLAATRGYGAETISYDRYTGDRVAISRRVAEERGATLIPPYDHPGVMAGQGTLALELIEEVGPLDLLLVCLGGGGLLAGCAVAATALSPGIEVVGVEPAAGDDWARSYAAGERVRLAEIPRTIADGQQTEAPGELTWATARPLVSRIAVVDDDAIRDAMVFLFERLKTVAEPSGASALAALLGGAVEARGMRVGVTLSGGNVGVAQFCRIVGERAG